MKVYSGNHTFNYSWEEVSTANWRKYCPWNDKSTHVIAVDTLSRTIDPETGILRTERLITINQNMPELVRKVLGCQNDQCHMYEASYVDPKKQIVTMVSQNLTWNNVISTRETVVYKPLNAKQTQFAQRAEVTALCGGWQRIKNTIEEMAVKTFRENAAKGREGFEAVLEMSRRAFAEEREKDQSELQQQVVNIRQAHAA